MRYETESTLFVYKLSCRSDYGHCDLLFNLSSLIIFSLPLSLLPFFFLPKAELRHFDTLKVRHVGDPTLKNSELILLFISLREFLIQNWDSIHDWCNQKNTILREKG